MREVYRVGSGLEDVQAFPEPVKRTVGCARWLAQTGDKHPTPGP